MHLTREQLQLFRHNGFLRLRERLPKAAVERLKEAVWSDIRAEVEPLARDREGRVVQLLRIVDRAPIFREMLSSSLVLEPLESLLGPHIELVKNRHCHATLWLGTETIQRPKLHRDALQWSRGTVTVMFFLEETTVEKGCTHVIPGTHLIPLGGGLLDNDRENWDRMGLYEETVPVPMPAGGMMVIDSTILHGVGVNTTNATRMSLTVAYHSVDELSEVRNPKRDLVRGAYIYTGNDRTDKVKGQAY